MDYGKVFLIAVLAALLIALTFGIWGFISDQNYQKAISAENPEDICKAPAGYTQQEWEEHMGHHPERYEECLDKNA